MPLPSMDTAQGWKYFVAASIALSFVWVSIMLNTAADTEFRILSLTIPEDMTTQPHESDAVSNSESLYPPPTQGQMNSDTGRKLSDISSSDYTDILKEPKSVRKLSSISSGGIESTGNLRLPVNSVINSAPKKKQPSIQKKNQPKQNKKAKTDEEYDRFQSLHDQWDPGMTAETVYPLNVQVPVFVASLPKSGTTSIWQYFNCGGHRASHQWIKQGNSTKPVQTGQCIRQNVLADRPPFQECGQHDIFTDTGFANYEKSSGSDCFYPSVDALEAMYKHYPDLTIILIVRDTNSWYHSMRNWGDGSLLDRWRPCNATGFPPFAARARQFKSFYEWHTDHIRKFADKHPTINYIELQLESTENGRILEDRIGIPSRCWSKCTPAAKLCEPIATPKAYD